jgi:hypothetical protein
MKKNKDAKPLAELLDPSEVGLHGASPSEAGPIDAQQAPLPPPIDPDIQEIDDIISANEMTSGWAELTRKGPSESDFAHCAKIPVAQFSIDRIREDYGGGEYAVRFRTSTNQFYKRCSFRIDARAIGRLDRRNQGLPVEPGDASALNTAINALTNRPASGNGAETLIAVMKDSADKQATMMAAMMQSQSQMVTAMFASRNDKSDNALMPLIVELLKQRGQGDGMTLADAVQAVAQLKELASGRPLPAPAKDHEETLTDKILNVVAGVATPLAAAYLTRGNPAPTVPLTPGVAHPPPPVAAGIACQAIAPTAQDAPPADLGVIGPYKEMILRAAIAGKDSGIWVDLISDNLDDDQFRQLTVILNQSNWMEKLFGSDPRAVLAQPWLENLRHELLTDPNPTESAAPAPLELVTDGPDSAS